MKKIIALVLSLVLILGCTSAMAQLVVKVNNTQIAGNGTLVDEDAVNKKKLVLKLDADATFKVDVTNPPAGYTVQNVVVNAYTNADRVDTKYTMTYTGTAADQTGTWTSNTMAAGTLDAKASQQWPQGETFRRFRAVVTYVNADGQTKTEEQTFWVKNTFDKNVGVEFRSRTWFTNKTAMVFGPALNGHNWQTYGVVDLTKGTQTLTLLGSGEFDIGTVTVKVAGDKVTVSYKMNTSKAGDIYDDITVRSAYLNVTTTKPTSASAKSDFAFDVPFSISEDLGGKTTIAVVVNMKVDFQSTSPFVYKFWRNLPDRAALVANMQALIDAAQ